ncbi:hypothetical protein P43SY_006212 [Pythium insidiosum]|uniref:Nucleoside diphosphate kinase-like domain-containing protein n=1 Tax=Pythium insidiosum TaxID=114742 RepID=A0AAD5LC96_PYTIN|nr:hypothetical protein P43SY_006212 [Pythium insidiosum]
MSTAKGSKAPPPPTATAPAPEAAALQTSVLLVQVEALQADDEIRRELKQRGFAIAQQALVYLTEDDATYFVREVCDPLSELNQSTLPPPAASPEQSSDEPETGKDGDDAKAASSARQKAGTPRDSKATPRSPASVHEPPSGSDDESLSDAVAGLSRGPVLMIAVQRVQAVAELRELVGPAASELWGTAPASLRGRLAKDAVQIGVRCSRDELTPPQEIAFLLQRTHPARHTPRAASVAAGVSATAAKSPAVELARLLEFLFPAHVQHSNSTGRLFVFGLYGPLDANAQLRAGEKGLHVVTDRELDTMSSRMEREDLLAVYRMCSLSQHEEEEVLRTVDQTLKTFPRHSRRDVEALFEALPRDPRGRLSFHDMQAAIMKERCRRVLCMKERLHPSLAAPIQNKFARTLKRLVLTKDEVAPASMFVRDLGFTGAENATLVARLLSNHAFQICHLDAGNSPSLTQNVRLLRQPIVVPGDPRAPWNPSTAVPLQSTTLRRK